MRDVFLNYANSDVKFVQQLVDDFNKAGISFWFESIDLKIGTNFREVTEIAITECKSMIVILSSNSRRTGYVAEKLSQAYNINKPIIGIFIDGDSKGDMEPYLIRASMLDMRGIRYESALPHLIELLHKVKINDQENITTKIQKSKYVFISYAQEDIQFIIPLRQFFKERGYSCWDYQDSERNHHSILRKELEDALRNATAAIFVLSPNWKASDWTQDEYDFATQLKTLIFRLMVHQMEETLGVTNRLWIDFMRDEKEGFAKLDNELRRAGLV
jgi:hypothetical protein